MHDVKTQYLCDCGRDFGNKGALVSHQKRCKADKPEKEEQAPKPTSLAVSKDKSLTSTDRKQFASLITKRQDTILRALTDELDRKSEDTIIDKIRSERGIVYSPRQLKEMIESIDDQIQAEVEKHIADERNKLNLERTEVTEAFEERESEMKKRHRAEFRALQEMKKQKLEEIRGKLSEVKENIVKKHAMPLIEKKQEYQSKLAFAKQQELEIQAQGRQRKILIRQYRGRLENTIRDVTNRSLEKLAMEAETREDAVKLMDMIPTFSEAVTMVSTPEGIEKFFRRLNPDMPTLDVKELQPPQETKDANVVDVAKAVVLDDEEEEIDVDELEEEHAYETYRE